MSHITVVETWDFIFLINEMGIKYIVTRCSQYSVTMVFENQHKRGHEENNETNQSIIKIKTLNHYRPLTI